MTPIGVYYTVRHRRLNRGTSSTGHHSTRKQFRALLPHVLSYVLFDVFFQILLSSRQIARDVLVRWVCSQIFSWIPGLRHLHYFRLNWNCWLIWIVGGLEVHEVRVHPRLRTTPSCKILAGEVRAFRLWKVVYFSHVFILHIDISHAQVLSLVDP